MTEEYSDLLYKSGQSLQKVEVFINTIRESGLFPINLSKRKEQNIKKYLKSILLTADAERVLTLYKNRVQSIAKQINQA